MTSPVTVSWAGPTVQDDSSTWSLTGTAGNLDSAEPVSFHVVSGLSTWPCQQGSQTTPLKAQGYQRKEMDIASLKSEAHLGVVTSILPYCSD